MLQSFRAVIFVGAHITVHFTLKNYEGACSSIILATYRICFVACFVLMTVRIKN